MSSFVPKNATTNDIIANAVRDAKQYAAAVFGVPCKATIKELEDGAFVLQPAGSDFSKFSHLRSKK